MEKGILVTGATGLLGTEVIRHLIRQEKAPLFALVRGRHQAQALHRLKSFWCEEPELLRALDDRIHVVCGDVTRESLGLTEEKAEKLAYQIGIVIHTAAETGVQRSREELLRINTEGTGNILSFAKRAAEKGGFERFVHISTAYVAGTRSGRILETDPLPDKYSTHYEESKAKAEILVRQAGLPYTICRPGMIIGNSKTGRTRNFNTIYYILKLLMQGKLPVVPVSAEKKLNIVPADYVAQAVTGLMKKEEARGQCFHVTASPDRMACAGDLADYICLWAKRELQVSLRKPVFVPMPFLKAAGAMHNSKAQEKHRHRISNLIALTPYFFDEKVFDRTGLDHLLGDSEPDWRSYIDKILEYACRCNFLHNTDRNVFEQALVRQQSKHAPIRYYDVAASGIKETGGEEMRAMILKAASALQKLGVRKGGKVALAGSNCTKYLSLDIAIGLVGAVSVPIYYTTPAAEIDILLKKSGAGWLFAGDKRFMGQVDALTCGIPVIAFGAALQVQTARQVMTWDAFLEMGDEEPGLPDVMVDPGDLATIRYTSGTTGEPKGVMFSAGQLKWMGQVMTALLPWREKQKEMRYLSFLPLSHVVEGILASNAPYYVHCPVKYYFLNEFDSLAEALPVVRPTVFFSVPRFYEKLWQQIEDNPYGRRYLSMTTGPAKSALGRILKHFILKKAGLDRCSSLIVGSAPMSEELLYRFRELGIEIHNAYGQTEAPLITINRMGDNIIPTIGTPLPETDVSVDEEGQLIIRGPQVCLGYYGLATDTISCGVLRTGDLGKILPNGHIELIGRKKEMIITSYGKNISVPKIEERLRNIPGVSEAVLIGENRPYCTALIWTEGAGLNLEARIDEMNRALSHPEQIRKWQIIDRPLSIQAGELTPNLKVRRAVVEEHYRDEIQKLYA